MGTHFKAAIFEEHVKEGLVGWVQKVKNKKGRRGDQSGQGGSHDGSSTGGGIQMGSIFKRALATEENQPATKPEGSS